MSGTILENKTIPSDNHCLNCGAELSGKYCHACGQQAGNTNSTIGGFVMEYLANAFMWDTRFLKTIWFLIRRPGHLTNEFISGKIVSYVHPLKLNMFMLFVFITLFLMFAGTTRLTDSVEDITHNEITYPGIKLKLLSNNPEYAEKLMQSPRDTVKLLAPLYLATEYPHIVTLIETIEDAPGESVDKWTAAIPHVLVEDKIVVEDNAGYLIFDQSERNSKELELIGRVWSEMVNIAARYYPIIVLLTAPFLSFSLSLVNRRKKYPKLNNFIFALHYTAFIELLTLVIYISYLIFAPSSSVLQWVLSIGSIIYLSIAFRNVYKVDSWVKSIGKALVTSILYLLICLIIFVVIFFVSCFLVASKL